MALIGVNQYQAPQQEKEESAMDKILKGMQIAGTVLGGYNTVKDIQLKGAQADAAKQTAQLSMAEKGMQEVPQAPTPPEPTGASLVPTQDSSLVPPQKEPVLVPEELSANRPNQPITLGGKQYTTAEGRKSALEQANKLYDERRQHQITIATNEAANGYRKVIDAEPTPAGDLALTFGFMKTIDPGSTVREGEAASVKNTTGAVGAARRLYNQVLRGDSLLPAQRADLKKQADVAFRAQLATQKELDTQFETRAKRFGLDPKDVITDISGLGEIYKLRVDALEELKRRGAVK